jgi:hypothetical protein
MAPELLAGDQASERTDLCALAEQAHSTQERAPWQRTRARETISTSWLLHLRVRYTTQLSLALHELPEIGPLSDRAYRGADPSRSHADTKNNEKGGAQALCPSQSAITDVLVSNPDNFDQPGP